MNEHTPGPWHVGPKFNRGTECCICSWKDGRPDTSRIAIANILDVDGNGSNEANARLIAAAPELLDELNATVTILENIASLMRREDASSALSGLLEARTNSCRIAIKLATGSGGQS